MKPISYNEVLRQLKADLIGKDSYRGITLTYSWLANQFGHFSLGFIPTFILNIYLSNKFRPETACLWSAAIISMIWLFFEIHNFFGPLSTKYQSLSRYVFIPRMLNGQIHKRKYVFQPAWKNIGYDTITDLLFFWFGACIASLFLFFNQWLFFIVLILAGLLIHPVRYWYKTKLFLQVPLYPFQFRLSQWNVSPIDGETQLMLRHFLKGENKGMHLFIFGPQNSGKSSLGVALGTELSIKHKTCVYITAMKLFGKFFDREPEFINDNNPPWDWRTSEIIIIDDINPGDPIKKDIITPESFMQYLNLANENKRAIINANVIWVLGNKDYKDNSFENWRSMLENIGVPGNNIISINLPGQIK